MKRLNAILSASGLMILALSLPSWAQTRTLQRHPRQPRRLPWPNRPGLRPGRPPTRPLPLMEAMVALWSPRKTLRDAPI